MQITRVVAARGRVVFQYQPDGNLVCYHDGRPVWASNTIAAPGRCVMQADGNLVCYDASGRPYWASNTHGNPGATLAVQDDGNAVIYAADGRPIWATGTRLSPRDDTAPPPQPDARWAIYGNFLASGIEPWGFMAPSWWLHDRPRWDRFVTAYRAAGYRHLPFALYGAYPGERPFDLRPDPARARRLVLDHLARGITPIVMVITDEPSGEVKTPDEAWDAVEEALIGISDLPVEWCTGWELNQVGGWTERGVRGLEPLSRGLWQSPPWATVGLVSREPLWGAAAMTVGSVNPRQGHDLITLCRRIRGVTGRAPWIHLAPRWWAPHYEDGDEDRWWRDVGDDCRGLLGQIEPDAPLDRSGDPREPAGLYLMLEYPRSDGARGIVGRLAARGKQFVLFEHSRDLARWQDVRRRVEADRRVIGIC